MAAVPTLPGDEYAARLRARRAAFASLTDRDARYSFARLAVFAAVALLALAWWRGVAQPFWIAVPVAAFAVLMQRHDRVIRARDAAARAMAFYERGLARIEDRWSGTGGTGDRFRDDRHLYANDLDLFGRGSLFELLSLARTRAGEETLAAWLKTPSTVIDIRARQQSIEELNPALDLREALALAGAEVDASVDSDALVRWAEAGAVLPRGALRQVAAVLTAAAVATAVFWAITGNSAPFLTVVAAEVLFSVPQRRRIQQALHAAEGPARDLDVLAHVLARLEQETFSSARLTELRIGLDSAGVPASRAIGRLRWLVELHDWQHNQFFAPIGAALLWGTHLAWAIEQWRHSHGAEVGLWLRTVGEFEALGSLSAYRYEHPDSSFPEMVDLAADGGRASAAFDGAIFDGSALGHPLIPRTQMVRNDVRLAGDIRLFIVSGSNMSGKSTLLRTVGVNAVLALAGAPVCAASLRLTPLVIGATLRIQDSLQEGRSRFYAEITRVRELTDAARGPVPLLFLLDELFHGTNSHDRLLGASGVLRTLLDRGAIGLITTHDLALTAVAEELAPHAVNVHFEDRFEQGDLHFDYRMKPGPVTRSNALALMRAVGLDVESGVSHE
jgi:hypothetical protein